MRTALAANDAAHREEAEVGAARPGEARSIKEADAGPRGCGCRFLRAAPEETTSIKCSADAKTALFRSSDAWAAAMEAIEREAPSVAALLDSLAAAAGQ